MKNFTLLFCLPVLLFTQVNQNMYTEITQINAPTTIDKFLSIGNVFVTNDDKYFVIRMGYKPTYYAVYELETQKYITLFKVPGWSLYLYYKDNIFYSSNGKSRNFELSVNNQTVSKLKQKQLSIINPFECYSLRLDPVKDSSMDNHVFIQEECLPHLEYLFCWKYAGSVLKIMKKM